MGTFETCNGRIVELARLIKMDLDKKCAILVILQFLVQNSFTADSLSKFRINFYSNITHKTIYKRVTNKIPQIIRLY